MSRLCDLCGRGANRANSRSHSNIASKRQQFVNLQTKRIAGVKTKACARCLRTLGKPSPSATPSPRLRRTGKSSGDKAKKA